MIKLNKITEDNVWKITNLEVHENQKEYVADNSTSLIEAWMALSKNEFVQPFGIYNDDLLVGFVMIGKGVSYLDNYPKELNDNSYCIWRFMIDKHYQNRGYGKEALNKTIDYIKNNLLDHSKYIYLSYEPENIIGKKLYESNGFVETPYYDEDEIIAIKKL